MRDKKVRLDVRKIGKPTNEKTVLDVVKGIIIKIKNKMSLIPFKKKSKNNGQHKKRITVLE
jgi:hypothetical protein